MCEVCNPLNVGNYPEIVITTMWVPSNKFISWVAICYKTSMNVVVC